MICAAAVHGHRAQGKEFPKGHLLEILAASMAANCRFATDIKTRGFDPRCTRKVHVYMSPGSNSISDTIHLYKISPNKFFFTIKAHSAFMTKHAFC